jgi:D-apiose dehydrogenase
MPQAGPWRIGLAGAGFVSQHHLLAWRKLGRVSVVAICDPDARRAAARAREFDIPHTYPDAAQMVAGEPLDALDIAAPRECHASLVRLAADHRLPTLCQKPLTPTLGEAVSLWDEVGGRIRLMVHENWRWRPYYRKIAEWIRAGHIGSLQQCLVKVFSSGLLPGSEGQPVLLVRQPMLATLERLIVAETLIHHLDTLRYLFGPLALTGASLGWGSTGVAGEDRASLLLRVARGGTVALLGNLTAHGYPQLVVDDVVVLGDRGTLGLQDGLLRIEGGMNESIRYDLAEAYQAAFDACIHHFIACLESGEEFETAPADNLETLRLVEEVYQTAGSSS